jgi:hypothetical protein
VLVAEDEALVLTSIAASSSLSATGGPGRSILHYFCREYRASSAYWALSTLEKEEGRGPLPSPSPDPHREGTEYTPPSPSLLRVITRGRPRAAPIMLCVTGETVEEQERAQPR